MDATDTDDSCKLPACWLPVRRRTASPMATRSRRSATSRAPSRSAFACSQSIAPPRSRRSPAPLPDQVALEVHAATYLAPPLLRSRGTGALRPKWFAGEACASPPELALFGHFLFFGAGYLIADRRDHPVCAGCTELTLVKARCRSPALAPSLWD